ncbi:MAG TPA: DUF4388 domain-containing protein [candidate division Zixibacteria bacterium]|nr:DUF4388 domain-containing protein [candidate division Zixibacteria bacterium]MDD4917089.1 DUF4388 domain-containing protein [candidate division Zixibacteria bacterium]MDM7972929.1 DUF4388 domain-containing protein [candidate division Zixibacteria bacterium]HOD65315.1 DUF4388 domain-containing protein [candidate division Zixibacteria bacterium]HPM36204.1 DUF4388 domain-containing protein [candidate division Zixibacteria bacterium]
MSLSGNLKTVSFPDILQLLATGKKTGLLEIRTASRQKEVAFRDGNIIHASSVNSAEDLLGQMLLNRGRLSKKDLDRAITLHKQTGRQLGTTLIDMGVFDKHEIAECLKQQIEEIVYNLFSWKEGEFLFHENAHPKSAPFLVELSTMSVIMEGTRRIDEWLEIQKVLPPDDVLLAISRSPRTNEEEFKISVDEFRLIGLINGERTLPDLINLSPMGEFVTCRAIYRLIVNHLIEAVGRREQKNQVEEDEEEAVLRIVFRLYNNAFYRIRTLFEEYLGEDNTTFATFAAQYRGNLLNFFPGVDPKSDLMPSFDKFLAAVQAIPAPIRFQTLFRDLDDALAEQLQFIFELLGVGAYRDGVTTVKGEISEPLATRRDLVKRYAIEENFNQAVKRSARVVKMVRG